MARFRLTQAFHFQSFRLAAGRTICDSAAAALPGDFVYGGLNANSLPAGCVPLDGLATTMKAASPRFANEATPTACTGVQSIDA
jgi:hypothetical protein